MGGVGKKKKLTSKQQGCRENIINKANEGQSKRKKPSSYENEQRPKQKKKKTTEKREKEEDLRVPKISRCKRAKKKPK